MIVSTLARTSALRTITKIGIMKNIRINMESMNPFYCYTLAVICKMFI